MLAILFPHMFEDIKYLLPEETPNGQASASQEIGGSSQPQPVFRRNPVVNGNAVAGPSRLSR